MLFFDVGVVVVVLVVVVGLMCFASSIVVLYCHYAFCVFFLLCSVCLFVFSCFLGRVLFSIDGACCCFAAICRCMFGSLLFVCIF